MIPAGSFEQEAAGVNTLSLMQSLRWKHAELTPWVEKLGRAAERAGEAPAVELSGMVNQAHYFLAVEVLPYLLTLRGEFQTTPTAAEEELARLCAELGGLRPHPARPITRRQVEALRQTLAGAAEALRGLLNEQKSELFPRLEAAFTGEESQQAARRFQAALKQAAKTAEERL